MKTSEITTKRAVRGHRARKREVWAQKDCQPPVILRNSAVWIQFESSVAAHAVFCEEFCHEGTGLPRAGPAGPAPRRGAAPAAGNGLPRSPRAHACVAAPRGHGEARGPPRLVSVGRAEGGGRVGAVPAPRPDRPLPAGSPQPRPPLPPKPLPARLPPTPPAEAPRRRQWATPQYLEPAGLAGAAAV